jgi:hypothetical protein
VEAAAVCTALVETGQIALALKEANQDTRQHSLPLEQLPPVIQTMWVLVELVQPIVLAAQEMQSMVVVLAGAQIVLVYQVVVDRLSGVAAAAEAVAIQPEPQQVPPAVHQTDMH